MLGLRCCERAFLQFRRVEVTLRCSKQASRGGGFSRCEAWALQHTALSGSGFGALEHRLKLRCMDVAAPQHVGSPQIRDRDCVSCSGKRILYYRATREDSECPWCTHAASLRVCYGCMFLLLQLSRAQNCSSRLVIFSERSEHCCHHEASSRPVFFFFLVFCVFNLLCIAFIRFTECLMFCVLTVMFLSYRLRFIDPDFSSRVSWIWEFKDFHPSGESVFILW